MGARLSTRTVLGIYCTPLGSGKVRIRMRFALGDIVRGDDTAVGDRDVASLECAWGIEIAGCQAGRSYIDGREC
jgi:hypothetical protein